MDSDGGRRRGDIHEKQGKRQERRRKGKGIKGGERTSGEDTPKERHR